jgi:phosphatidylglycerol:prolipoprotein diacylglycerol transferase
LIISGEGITFGFVLVRWGGFLIAFGVAVGALLSYFEAKRRREDPALVYYLFTPLVIWGTIGARLWYIFTPSLSAVQMGLTTQYYLSHPVDVLALWIGGFGIPGLWMGGIIALLFVSRQNDIPFWDLADLFAPGFALAHLIGRLGNYVNRELYGLPAPEFFPWRIFIEREYRLAGFESVEYYHPLFAYEAILLFICFIFLMRLSRRYLPSGVLIITYSMFYSAIRFGLEFLRLDVALVNGWNANQIFFAAAFALAGICLYWIKYMATS